MKFSVYLVLSKISTESKSASACMVFLPPFFDSFYSNPETRVAKLSIATGVGGPNTGGCELVPWVSQILIFGQSGQVSAQGWQGLGVSQA